MKTIFSYSSSAFSIANTSRYTSVHASCSGVCHECCNGESYSSTSMATFNPVFLYAVLMIPSNLSASIAVVFGVMPYNSSYSPNRISRYERIVSALAPPRLMSRRITGYCFQSFSSCMIFSPSNKSFLPSRYVCNVSTSTDLPNRRGRLK